MNGFRIHEAVLEIHKGEPNNTGASDQTYHQQREYQAAIIILIPANWPNGLDRNIKPPIAHP
jgi:hypothetical protein